MSTKKQSFFLSLLNAIIFTLLAHVKMSVAYAEAWKAPLNFTPRKPAALVVYFFLVLIAFYIVKVYRTRGFVIVMSIFLLAFLGLRSETRMFLEYQGYTNISVGIPTMDCFMYGDLGLEFSGNFPDTSERRNGFACIENLDTRTFRSLYYTE